MCAHPVDHLGDFHNGFAEGRVRVDRQLKVFCGGAHFHGEPPFRDKFAGDGSGNADAQDLVRLRIEDDFREPAVPIQGRRAPGCRPWESRYLDLHALAFGLRLGESTPSDLGVGEDYGGGDARFERDIVSRERFCRDTPLV